jgi:hypothetical protein
MPSARASTCAAMVLPVSEGPPNTPARARLLDRPRELPAVQRGGGERRRLASDKTRRNPRRWLGEAAVVVQIGDHPAEPRGRARRDQQGEQIGFRIAQPEDAADRGPGGIGGKFLGGDVSCGGQRSSLAGGEEGDLAGTRRLDANEPRHLAGADRRCLIGACLAGPH